MKISSIPLLMIDTNQPHPDDLLGEAAGAVVDTLDFGMSAVPVVEELWRLLGDPRADEAALLIRRFNAQNLQLHAADVSELRALAAPLEDAVVGTLVSRERQVLPAELVPALRPVAPSIFDRERPIADEVHAVAEALQAAWALAHFLSKAEARGCEVHAG